MELTISSNLRVYKPVGSTLYFIKVVKVLKKIGLREAKNTVDKFNLSTRESINIQIVNKDITWNEVMILLSELGAKCTLTTKIKS